MFASSSSSSSSLSSSVLASASVRGTTTARRRPKTSALERIIVFQKQKSSSSYKVVDTCGGLEGRQLGEHHHALGPIDDDGRVSPLRDHLPVHATPLARSPGRREQSTTVTGRSSTENLVIDVAGYLTKSEVKRLQTQNGKHTKRYGREIENPRASVPTNARVSD